MPRSPPARRTLSRIEANAVRAQPSPAGRAGGEAYRRQPGAVEPWPARYRPPVDFVPTKRSAEIGRVVTVHPKVIDLRLTPIGSRLIFRELAVKARDSLRCPERRFFAWIASALSRHRSRSSRAFVARRASAKSSSRGRRATHTNALSTAPPRASHSVCISAAMRNALGSCALHATPALCRNATARAPAAG